MICIQCIIIFYDLCSVCYTHRKLYNVTSKMSINVLQNFEVRDVYKNLCTLCEVYNFGLCTYVTHTKDFYNRSESFIKYIHTYKVQRFSYNVQLYNRDYT